MIYFEQAGRLGNQLFRYAAARAMQIARGGKEKIVAGMTNYEAHQYKDGFVDELVNFNIAGFKRVNQPIVSFYPLRNKIIYRLLIQIPKLRQQPWRSFEANWAKTFNKVGIQFTHDGYYDFSIPKTKDVFMDGNFQDIKYFNGIKDILFKEFTPKRPEKEENKELYKAIRNTNSICISIRRGDFLSSEFKGDFFVCGKDYFLKAMDEIKKHVENPTFIFFSDDIDWVRQNIKVDVPCCYESGSDPVWEKLRLMYSCKHFIISNSSFSWWAQYLGRHPNKVVISPDHWYNNKDINATCKMIQPEFIKIPCPYHE